MYDEYAEGPRMRLSMGIRRRLSPLMEAGRRQIERLYSLLFSMPGSPIIYYGDEIGMGDNIYLGDRNGVRRPMQGSADRNGGVSKANPQRLYAPVIIDPEYHAESINVESQQANPNSLLWWTQRLIALRNRHLASLEAALPRYLPTRRWFGAKGRRVTNAHVVETVPLSGPDDARPDAYLTIVSVEYSEGDPERYLLPLTARRVARDEEIHEL